MRVLPPFALRASPRSIHSVVGGEEEETRKRGPGPVSPPRSGGDGRRPEGAVRRDEQESPVSSSALSRADDRRPEGGLSGMWRVGGVAPSALRASPPPPPSSGEKKRRAKGPRSCFSTTQWGRWPKARGGLSDATGSRFPTSSRALSGADDRRPERACQPFSGMRSTSASSSTDHSALPTNE